MRRGILVSLASAAIAVAVVFGCGVDTTGTALAPAGPDTSTPDSQPSLPPVADAPLDTFDGFFPDPTPGFAPQHVDKKYLRLAEAAAVDVAVGTTIKIVTSVPPTLDGVPSPALVHDATNDVVVWTVKSFQLQGRGDQLMWGRVRVTGAKPLVIVSLGDVTIDGVLSGYSSETELGPGAVAGKTAQDGAGRAGGGGAGNGGAGGTGGGASGDPITPAGEMVAMTTKLQGGLAGGQSGTTGAARCGGGGSGGGALQISTMGKIVVGAYGGIDVGGAGGRGGCPVAPASGGGGGGGGAGGTVQLEAVGTIEIKASAQIAAMGGGGGEGGCANGSGNDAEPAPFTPSTGRTAAAGGFGSCLGLGGVGAGANNTSPGNGAGGGVTFGGGGGGGGHGKVWLRTRGTTPTIASGVIAGVQLTTDTTF